MYESMLELFGIFGIELTPEFCAQLTMAQLIPLILVATLAFCIIGGILRCINSLVRLCVGGGGLR